MNYTITRDGQQYGPYTLSDLQRYVASGEVLLTDLASSDGMDGQVPVAQIVGTIAVPQPQVPVPVNPAALYPNPPNLHWGWVLGLAIVTRGVFSTVWGLVLAIWLKRVNPNSKAVYLYGLSTAILVGAFFYGMVSAATHTGNIAAMSFAIGFGSYAVDLVARFIFADGMEKHYRDVEDVPVVLSGVMTFFFGAIYFQYHVNDIVGRKKADGIVPVV